MILQYHRGYLSGKEMVKQLIKLKTDASRLQIIKQKKILLDLESYLLLNINKKSESDVTTMDATS